MQAVSRGASAALTYEVEQFLFLEADILDERRYPQWLALLTPDITYRMPMVRNLRFRDIDKEYLQGPLDIAWIDEGLETLTQRVEQIMTGIHWAEEPLSRTSHMVSNVRVVSGAPTIDDPETVEVKSRFFVYRNRLRDEEDFLVGKRLDVLRRVEGDWRIARRTIYLDQSVLLAKNLTVFL